MQTFLWILLGFGLLLLLDRLLLWMEAKGWIYWRKVKRRASSGGGMIAFGGMFDPGAKHLAEAREEHVLAEEDDGDDDDKRTTSDQVS